MRNRIEWIRGQADAVERALEEEHDRIGLVQQITRCRGAKTGLRGVVLEDPVRTHLVEADSASGRAATDAREPLIEVVHSNFK